MLLGIKPGATCMLGKCSSEPHPNPISLLLLSLYYSFFIDNIFINSLLMSYNVFRSHTLPSQFPPDPPHLSTHPTSHSPFPSNPLCLIFVDQILLAVGPAWNVVLPPDVTSLKKMDSPSPRSSQMSTTLHCGVGLSAHCLNSMLGFRLV